MTIALRKAPASSLTGLNAVRELIADDMEAVNRLIQARLRSDVVLINQLGHYIVNSGGKRLRPLLTLLSAHAHGYEGRKHVEMAAVIEFIHTATLLHDDVVDESKMRRGRETANEMWGNEATVLVGDFLYSRSFQMMVHVGNMRIMEIMSDTTNTIAEGEVMQLINQNDPSTSEARYLDIIQCKTAKLFEAAARIGPVLSGRSREQENAMGTYGRHLGIAYQLLDDVLDYSARTEQLGKNIGDDLAEGKPTLPLLYAMWNGTSAQSELIRRAIEQGGKDQIVEVKKAIESTGAIAYTAQLARRQIAVAVDALVHLASSPYKESLISLAEFSVQRDY